MTSNNVEIVKNMRQRTTRLDREGDYWTEEEKAQLKSMFEEGIGITEIAMILQRTEPAVMQQIEKMDLYQRERYPQRRKSVPKAPVCLCEVCKLDRSGCPLCEAYKALQEVG